MSTNLIKEKMQYCEIQIKMDSLVLKTTHICPHCGFTVTSNDGISMFFGWRKCFLVTMEPSYVLIPQSWCIRCRSKEARRYE